MVFEDLDPSLCYYLCFEHKGHRDKFIGFVLSVSDIQCHIAVLDCLSAGLDEPDYRLHRDSDLSFKDIYYSKYCSYDMFWRQLTPIVWILRYFRYLS
jgi:hypothetical protein